MSSEHIPNPSDPVVFSRIVLDMIRRRMEGRQTSVTDMIYRWNIEDYLEHMRPCPEDAEYCVAVTDLVYCGYKYHLRARYPELLIHGNVYAGWAGYGRLVHAGLQEILRRYGFGTEIEVEKTYTVADYDNRPHAVVLRGRVDAYGELGGEPAVVEIKSSRSDTGIPREPHILQLRIYMRLLNTKQGILVYITPDRITEYAYTEPMSDHEITMMIRDTLFSTKHRPRYPWECNYCPFSSLCPYKQIQPHSTRR